MHICDWICEKGSSTHIQYTYFDDSLLVNTTDLKFSQCVISTLMNSWNKFQLCMSFDNQVMVFQVWICV